MVIILPFLTFRFDIISLTDGIDVLVIQEEGVLKGQELENAVSDVDYTKAVQITFQLCRPHKLLKLFGEISRGILSTFGIRLRMEYEAKALAQFVFFRVFNMLPPKEIIEIRGFGELLEGLIPYCQRHFSRIDRLERSIFLLDYCLTGMSVIELEMEEKEIEDKSVKHSNEADEEQLAKTALVEHK
ncbi:unnamed protein product [Ilex paraguariensis]|uniref:U3 small nucleolar RNA-associated protein 13 C-terminal domain-containing protein n=1 Tax=Ilex paraguariensis TaxID=185542 RepID=A0ABC8SZM1_9AQUA